jgi:2'-5' RNA ligase
MVNSRLAVDVVLLPSSLMADRVIEVNRELVRRCGNRIVLNRLNCFPHISLCMGVLEEKDIPVVSKILTRIGEKVSPLNLTAIDLSAHADSKGETISSFEIKITKALRRLHESIMNELVLFLNYEVTEEMLFTPPPVSEGTLRWINTFPEESSFKNFRPHITAGFGRARPEKLPIMFTASKLALCHLGNHCTCRKILAVAEFGNN